jgi:hypothetical protein
MLMINEKDVVQVVARNMVNAKKLVDHFDKTKARWFQ